MRTRPTTRSTRTRSTRTGLIGAATGLLALGWPAAASAHVTVQPQTLEGGGFSVVSFRVPNERDDAATVRLRVLLPADQPLGSVQTTPVPGWRVTTTTRTLEEPIEFYGSELTEVVSQVTWTATGRGVRPGQFQDFELSLGALPESGELVFRALQRYSDGERVDWNQVAVDESVEPERPSPVLTLVPPTSGSAAGAAAAEDQAAEDQAAEDQAAGTTSTATEEAPTGGGSSSVVALVLSGAALLVAVAAMALALMRRAR